MKPEVWAQKSMMPVCRPVRMLVPLPSWPMLKTWISMAPDVRFETSSEKRLSTSYNGWAWVSAKVSLRVWVGVAAHPVRPTNGIATDAAIPVAPIFRSLRRSIMMFSP